MTAELPRRDPVYQWVGDLSWAQKPYRRPDGDARTSICLSCRDGQLIIDRKMHDEWHRRQG